MSKLQEAHRYVIYVDVYLYIDILFLILHLESDNMGFCADDFAMIHISSPLKCLAQPLARFSSGLYFGENRSTAEAVRSSILILVCCP